MFQPAVKTLLALTAQHCISPATHFVLGKTTTLLTPRLFFNYWHKSKQLLAWLERRPNGDWCFLVACSQLHWLARLPGCREVMLSGHDNTRKTFFFSSACAYMDFSVQVLATSPVLIIISRMCLNVQPWTWISILLHAWWTLIIVIVQVVPRNESNERWDWLQQEKQVQKTPRNENY